MSGVVERLLERLEEMLRQLLVPARPRPVPVRVDERARRS